MRNCWQCGAPAVPGQPYCARHLAMAYGGGEPLEEAETDAAQEQNGARFCRAARWQPGRFLAAVTSRLPHRKGGVLPPAAPLAAAGRLVPSRPAAA